MNAATAHSLRLAHDDLEHQIAQRTAQLAEANAQLENDLRLRELADGVLRRRNIELTELNVKLTATQTLLVQSEKMASIGQLAAGVAHEINNPIGYVLSNLGTLRVYVDQLLNMLACYEIAEADIVDPQVLQRIQALRRQYDLAFLREDIPLLMSESKEGIERVCQIVQNLKDFSRLDANQEWVLADLHRGIDSTLTMVASEVKYKADVVKHYAALPNIECLPSQINQVVMNLLMNAAQSIVEGRGTITVRTGVDDGMVWFEVADTGTGIAPEQLSRIFDPFFTTKPVGKGTGLGLSLAYGIVQKHGGRIEVESQLDQGTRFRVHLPIRHATSIDELASTGRPHEQ